MLTRSDENDSETPMSRASWGWLIPTLTTALFLLMGALNTILWNKVTDLEKEQRGHTATLAERGERITRIEGRQDRLNDRMDRTDEEHMRILERLSDAQRDVSGYPSGIKRKITKE